MVFALAGMVGYLYWQQTRMLQHLQSLSMVVAQQAREPEEEPEQEVEVPVVEPETEEDDRVSVEEKVEVVEGSPDVDDVHQKTAPQLRDLLSAKGIPYGKRDSKSVLLQLLKATM